MNQTSTLGGVVSLLAIMIWGAISCAAPSVLTSTGFTANTTLQIVLDHQTLYRYELVTDDNNYIHGVIRVATGHATQSDGRIMVYGDRTEPRLPGEADWRLYPRPLNFYIAQTITEISYQFAFGPMINVPNYTTWTQTYRYTAACFLDTGGSTSGTTTLDVITIFPQVNTTTPTPSTDDLY